MRDGMAWAKENYSMPEQYNPTLETYQI